MLLTCFYSLVLVFIFCIVRKNLLSEKTFENILILLPCEIWSLEDHSLHYTPLSLLDIVVWVDMHFKLLTSLYISIYYN